MDAIKFTASFKAILGLPREKQEEKFLDLFCDTAKNASPMVILEAASQSNEILTCAQQDFLDQLWQTFLDEQLILIGSEEGEALRSQPGIKNFDVIMGFYYYSLWWRQIEQPENVQEKLLLLKKGVSFHSFHATKELIKYYMNIDAFQCFDEIHMLVEEIKIHGSPGYFFSAKCYEEAFQNTQRFEARYGAVLCFYTACELEIYSENAIHNSCFGKRERSYPDPVGHLFHSVDELCRRVRIDDFMKYRIKQESKQEAQIFLQQHFYAHTPLTNRISV